MRGQHGMVSHKYTLHAPTPLPVTAGLPCMYSACFHNKILPPLKWEVFIHVHVSADMTSAISVGYTKTAWREHCADTV